MQKLKRGPKVLPKGEKKIQVYFMVKGKHSKDFSRKVETILKELENN